ncbi:hypothetical protein D7W79_33505 [Corallococcus exercitus]|uniref:Uncharacterized protein n=2 Tax=Corallococcus exercitus TaxID=2316736 RepID=A0A3A8HCY6_9BACT|nr:hypothetical protein [Corallococcus exercitus]RKG69039.1 hypothetical protein D7W79_33505 [Corallococcus exercitus]
MGTPQSFNWAVAPTGQIDPQAYQAMSTMPLWSPVGSFTAADADFFTSYRQVLNQITFKVSPERQGDLKRLKDLVTLANNDVTKATTEMNQAYLSQQQNGGVVFAARYPDVSSWIQGEGSSYQHAIDNAQVNFNRTQDQLLEMQKASMPADLQNAIDAIKRPTANPATSTNPVGWVKVPDGAGILSWQPGWTIATSGQDWRAELASGTVGSFTVELSAADATQNLTKSWANGSASYGNPFWSVGGSGGWEKMDLTTTDKSVKATISVKSSAVVPITPGSWYDGGFLSTIARNKGGGYSLTAPWVSNGGPGSQSLFGQYGLLPTRVSALVVAYQPSFSITMSSATFNQYHEKFEASGGLRIGPFSFGGSGGHESNYIHTTQGGTTFTGGSTSEDPVIIGVLVSFPGINDPGFAG